MMTMRFLSLPLLSLAACAPSPDIAETSNEPSSPTRPISENPTRPIAENRVTAENLAKWRADNPSWYTAVEPFQLIGEQGAGIHYVGTEGLGMFFIPTAAGHIVIDGGMPDQGPMVADAITKLGYDPKDIKILLNSHAHLDHSGGLADLKAMSGAQLIASEGDRSALEGGFYLGSEDEEFLFAPPVKVDRIIADGETVSHGGVTLTAHITPGHTRGCTSWTLDVVQGGKSYDVLVFCSATVAANRLVDPPQYDGIVDDYRSTFNKTRDWQPDVFLANHPGFFGLKKRRTQQQAGDPLAFVDDQAFGRFITRVEGWFKDALKKQTAAAGS
ncbi:subclass B3 metallo-beta-lactamase [Parasphingorhabdus cellanae]|uniref:Subclass B3 metallo-beta-lactamase n=1 Tax=Parasphingorhabdus cellanae TaxID=2806553 RepID=A0ABX7T3J2_9SPHN|nr:subclass B3 metallo-beta-lactamase [Parasphingorhabdus cellanae]QTD54553.1 subclass B3 metallo-beta-lactamase [Parasphingorhabdus cellanae]